MRVFIVAALLALHPQAAAPAAAQDPGRRSADSARAMDTEPSIPVATPTRGDRPAAAGTPSDREGAQAGPDTPTSPSDAAAGAGQGEGVPPLGGEPGTDPGSRGGAAAGAEPYASGLPERAAPARTLRAHWHVYIAFAVVWALLFGYVVSLGRRFKRLEEELDRLAH